MTAHWLLELESPVPSMESDAEFYHRLKHDRSTASMEKGVVMTGQTSAAEQPRAGCWACTARDMFPACFCLGRLHTGCVNVLVRRLRYPSGFCALARIIISAAIKHIAEGSRCLLRVTGMGPCSLMLPSGQAEIDGLGIRGHSWICWLAGWLRRCPAFCSWIHIHVVCKAPS